ncbi:unnamed protein product [Ceutorhynchus assimilis]|uniref:Structural maintenance of chromosomes protein 5 n=1 Tax=Ceutorhynchus assimilis TaxID=467358 RepID=A0A9N9MUV0_9CUCU|nr:unnamed protein product [Ceutorhynchus assimilis]
MFKPGFIKKIQVQNFVTYNYAELAPGPNLNMLIGPNGTGKSTMVAAIILGLGGSPKTVGRGTKISEYVKHGCEFAKINIYLQGKEDDAIVKISRDFDTQDRTQWKLNGKICKAANVQEYIKEFNIQVDNLCQFLPQDRVADFAKLNKKELLKQTQIALCREDLLAKQQGLIEARERHKHLKEQIVQQKQNLQEAQDANARLEGRVINFNKKIKYKERIAHINRKLAWLEYEHKRAELGKVKAERAQAQHIYDKYKNAIKPMEKVIQSHKQCLQEMQQSNSKIKQNIRNNENHMNTTSNNVEALKSNIKEIEKECQNKLAEVGQWDNQIREAAAKLQELKKSHEDTLSQLTHLNKDAPTLSSEINKWLSHKTKLQNQKDPINAAIIEANSEIRFLQNEQNKVENVKQTRLNKLRGLNNDAYTAVLWIRNNKHLFKGEVYEPMMLEVNVLDETKAKYVEAMIPMRDKLAFTCTEKDDMNLLIRSLREQQRLSVNVVYSGPTNDPYNQPRIPIERLRRFGFYTYVNTLFTAPEPIMRYLCLTYYLNNIPVGDESTNDHYQSVPQEIKVFFSDNSRYAISVSQYSGQRSTRQNEIKAHGHLLSLDVLKLEQVKGRSREMNKKVQQLQSQLEKYDAEISKFDARIQEYRQRLTEIQRQKQQADGIERRIAVAKQHLLTMQNNKKNPEEIKAEAHTKIYKLKPKMYHLVKASMKYDEELKSLIKTLESTSELIEASRQVIELLDNETIDLKTKIQETGDILQSVSARYDAIMQEAKSLLEKAKGLSKGHTPIDPGFQEFLEIYDQLGNNQENLQTEKEDLNSRIACLNTADDVEMQEYQDRNSLIERLLETISTTSKEIDKISGKMNKMQEQWLNPLKEVVAAINLRFASAFERMGCAGEVTVCSGDNDQDFADYGISIMVTYRSGEPLQELNPIVQSGGERAVATATFMLSLQELTPVPFRCVDEINQGMDVNNERRIFDLIMESTSQPGTSQYFLITPKLVPNLKYTREARVHIVHNGPFINPDRKWFDSKFCNPDSIKLS